MTEERFKEIIFAVLVSLRGQPFIDTQLDEVMKVVDGIYDEIAPMFAITSA